MSRTLGELAVRFGCELRGDPDARVEAAGTLESGPGHLGFVTSPAYREALRATSVTAVVLDTRLARDCPVAALVCRNPHATFARMAAVLHPETLPPPGIAPTARIAPTASVDAGATVGEYCVVADGARLEAGVVLGPYVVVGRDAR
ncbi:UDP-3-O-(3-hydroxymyristoyl)glucosamine N-acyltransferase, partial [bacterium]